MHVSVRSPRRYPRAGGYVAISLKKSAVSITIYAAPSVQDFDYATFGLRPRPWRAAGFDIFVRHIFNLAKVIKMKLTQLKLIN